MTDIPDIRSALIEGRYAYDFVSDICGDFKNEETLPRLREVEQLLANPEGRKALYVLILAGTRRMLDAVAELPAGNRPATAELIAGLVECLKDDSKWNRLARDPSTTFGGDPSSGAV